MDKDLLFDCTPVSHKNGLLNRVSGHQLFINDIQFPGMVYGCFYRSVVSRARILQIDTVQSSRAPGVLRVFTYEDFSQTGMPRYGSLVADQPVLADGMVKYAGEPVALVIADTERHARQAAQQVKTIYEELPPLITLEESLSGSVIHDPAQRPAEQRAWADTNFMGVWNYGWGDLVSAEARSDFVLETTYCAPFVHHFAIEPHGAIGVPAEDHITVYSPIQHPFVARQAVSKMLGIGIDKVRIHSVNLGGSFGSKAYPKLEPIVALFAMMIQRPLKIIASGDEAFFFAQREASQVHIRTGFSNTGEIAFQDIQADFLVGAYTDISPRIIAKAGFHAAGPYRTLAARIQARGLFTNTPPTTAFRGFGAPHIAMALEGQLNQAARILGRDPLSLREQNMRAKGEIMVSGETEVDGEWKELLTRVAQALDWESPKLPGHGRGIAFGMKSCMPGTTSSARVRIQRGGEVFVEIGTTEMGQGAMQSFSILVAGALGIPAEQVSLRLGDTGLVPPDALTASSRSVVHMGNALKAACDDLREQLFTLAKEDCPAVTTNFSIEAERIHWDNGSISIKELLAKHIDKDTGELIGEGCFTSEKDSAHPLGGKTPFYEAVATAVELHVDQETGIIYIDRMAHVTDAGKIINPTRAAGVDEGGNIMGIGVALSEQLVYSKTGHLLNGSSLDYRIPTVADIPEDLNSQFLENSDGPGPGGSKGIGEGGILAIVPAISGAILDCTGILVTDIPITPEKLWKALKKEGKRADAG